MLQFKTKGCKNLKGAIVATLFPILSFAQVGGVSSKFQSVATEVINTLNIVVPVLGLIGFVGVFFLYKTGKDEAKTRLIQLIIGLIVYGSAASIIKFFIP